MKTYDPVALGKGKKKGGGKGKSLNAKFLSLANSPAVDGLLEEYFRQACNDKN